MSVLSRLLAELSTARGPVRVADLARDLGAEASAVEGMVDLLHRKGLLEPPSIAAGSDLAVCTSGCRSSCAGTVACPFVVGLPTGRTAAVSVEKNVVP